MPSFSTEDDFYRDRTAFSRRIQKFLDLEKMPFERHCGTHFLQGGGKVACFRVATPGCSNGSSGHTTGVTTTVQTKL